MLPFSFMDRQEVEKLIQWKDTNISSKQTPLVLTSLKLKLN